MYIRYENKLRSFKIRNIYFFTVLLNLIFVFFIIIYRDEEHHRSLNHDMVMIAINKITCIDKHYRSSNFLEIFNLILHKAISEKRSKISR
jgi:hypothetical protein